MICHPSSDHPWQHFITRRMRGCRIHQILFQWLTFGRTRSKFDQHHNFVNLFIRSVIRKIVDDSDVKYHTTLNTISTAGHKAQGLVINQSIIRSFIHSFIHVYSLIDCHPIVDSSWSSLERGVGHHHRPTGSGHVVTHYERSSFSIQDPNDREAHTRWIEYLFT